MQVRLMRREEEVGEECAVELAACGVFIYTVFIPASTQTTGSATRSANLQVVRHDARVAEPYAGPIASQDKSEAAVM